MLIANNPEELQEHIRELDTVRNTVYIKMNLGKLKVMYNELLDPWDEAIDDTTWELIDSSGSLQTEINSRGNIQVSA